MLQSDVLLVELKKVADGVLDFSPFGGIPNNAGSGKNGDINLYNKGSFFR